MKNKLSKEDIENLLQSVQVLTKKEVQNKVASLQLSKEEINYLLKELKEDNESFNHTDTKWVIEALESLNL